ncbi:MAG: integrase arm-type DNA-binding domain-containing protein [Methylococcales bacterium]
MATNKLPETTVRTAKPKEKTYRLSDGAGLYLLVNPDGSKWWRLDYTFRQKRKTLSLGTYPTVTLSKARDSALVAKQNINNGFDPSILRKAEKQQISIENIQQERLADGLPMVGSFEDVAREWGAINVTAWDKKDERNKRLLERNIFPVLGHKPIDQITPAELRDVLLVMRDKNILESARRTLRICARIFRYAVLNDKCTQDITLPIRDVLPPVKVTHYAAVTEPNQVKLLLQSIDDYEGSFIVKCALQLAPLVFVRPLELRSLEWKTINFETTEWRYLVSKTDTPHVVPLSYQAIQILEKLHPLTGHGRFAFQSQRTPNGDRYISENTLNAALKRLGWGKEDMTSHGFRAMARTLLDEEMGFRPDFIEHQLAHAVKDPNGRAYNRTSFLPERKKMMQSWADYLDNLKTPSTDNVIPIKEANI